MPVVKKRNQQTETRLLLESGDPVELPPAEIADTAVLVQFDKFKQFVPELLAELRGGTTAEPVPVMLDGSTFAVHGATRTFWVKLWHTNGSELTKIERAQIISCIPSTRGVQVVVDGYADEEFDEDEEYDSDEEFSDAELAADDEFDNGEDLPGPDTIVDDVHEH